MGNSAGSAAPFLAAPLGGGSTVGAGLVPASAEILPVNGAVARLAECDAVGDIEAQRGGRSPRLDVVGMERASLPALLAGVGVAGVDSLAPLAEADTESGAVALQGAAIFVGVAAPAATGTRARAEDLAPLVGGEWATTGGAHAPVRSVAARPAGLGAIASGFSAVCPYLERRAANLAGLGDAISWCHGPSIAQHALEPKYVAVTLERMAGMGLEPRLAETKSPAGEGGAAGGA